MRSLTPAKVAQALLRKRGRRVFATFDNLWHPSWHVQHLFWPCIEKFLPAFSMATFLALYPASIPHVHPSSTFSGISFVILPGGLSGVHDVLSGVVLFQALDSVFLVQFPTVNRTAELARTCYIMRRRGRAEFV